ncbi:MAG: leucine-rich repeat domain-containing protein [Alphaproteobacteria bacterium]|nr:leucine-rich repeat domain-containing protein [Alphaproteobacteria bacterium]
MATIAEQLTSLANTKTAIKDAIVAKGVTVADDTPFSGYAAKIGEIQGGGGAPATKFGASVDTWIGDVNENGVLKKTTWTGALNFAGVKEIGDYVLHYAFYGCAGITSVDLSSLTVVKNSGLYYAFCDCTGITSIDLSSLQKCDGYNTMSSAFYGCIGITSVDLSLLTTVNSYGLQNAFYGCTGVTSVDLSSLTKVESYGLSRTFYSCKKITTMLFPSLVSVQSSSFGTSSSNGTFASCTGLNEIHFRKDAQSVIESLTAYSSKFGATNATIYFDLIGTITVNGVAYARDERQSIRVDKVKTFVAWKDANDNVVYTSYENNAEPAVGTPVYSDAGTTQVGTVEGVA